MKSNGAIIFYVLALSAIVINVRCGDEDDDASVVDAADIGDEVNFPDFDHNSIQCSDTEVYSTCNANPTCQRTCDNIDKPDIPCTKKSCIGGCVCKTDFVRSQLYGGCIPADQCGRVRH